MTGVTENPAVVSKCSLLENQESRFVGIDGIGKNEFQPGKMEICCASHIFGMKLQIQPFSRAFLVLRCRKPEARFALQDPKDDEIRLPAKCGKRRVCNRWLVYSGAM
ncbi:MAG: hypothetical protein Q4F64_00785 [Corynebacterium casei]|nr:hypothetical protein [Corynebacterium casei]